MDCASVDSSLGEMERKAAPSIEASTIDRERGDEGIGSAIHSFILSMSTAFSSWQKQRRGQQQRRGHCWSRGGCYGRGCVAVLQLLGSGWLYLV